MLFVAVTSFLGTLMLFAGLGFVAPRYELAGYQPQGGTPPAGGKYHFSHADNCRS